MALHNNSVARDRYRIKPGKACFTTHVVRNHVPVFTSADYSRIVASALRHMREKAGISIYAYVIMPDHLHLLSGVPSPDLLQKALAGFRRFTGKTILEALTFHRCEWALERLRVYDPEGSNADLWRAGYMPKDASEEPIFLQKLNYIHDNPVRCGFVWDPADWKFSSAANYAGRNVRYELEVDFL